MLNKILILSFWDYSPRKWSEKILTFVFALQIEICIYISLQIEVCLCKYFFFKYKYDLNPPPLPWNKINRNITWKCWQWKPRARTVNFFYKTRNSTPRRFSFYLLFTLLSHVFFHLLTSPVHHNGFGFCFFPGFLAIFILSSNNSKIFFCPIGLRLSASP